MHSYTQVHTPRHTHVFPSIQLKPIDCIRTYTCIYTNAHKRTHTPTHTQTHTHTRTHVFPSIHTKPVVCIHTYTYINTNTHTPTDTNTHTNTQTPTYTYFRQSNLPPSIVFVPILTAYTIVTGQYRQNAFHKTVPMCRMFGLLQLAGLSGVGISRSNNTSHSV